MFDRFGRAINDFLRDNRPAARTLLERNAAAVVRFLHEKNADAVGGPVIAELLEAIIDAVTTDTITKALRDIGVNNPTPIEIENLKLENQHHIHQMNYENHFGLFNEDDTAKRLEENNQDLPVSSRHGQQVFHQTHPAFMFDKSIKDDLKKLEKKKELANILMRKSHEALYLKEINEEALLKIKRAAIQLETRLMLLATNCEFRMKFFEHKSKTFKESRKQNINFIIPLLQQLKDVQTNINARLAGERLDRFNNKALLHGYSTERFKSKADAKKAIDTPKNDVPLTGFRAGGGENSYQSKKHITKVDRYDVIRRKIRAGEECIETASIQYKEMNAAGKSVYHQESVINPDLMQFMGAREGLPPNNIPAQHVMEWAIQEVADFQALIQNEDDNPIIYFHADGYHTTQVEAVILVCMANNLKFIIPDNNPVKVKHDDLVKRLAKAKAHPEYGMKLKTADELTSVVADVTTKTLNTTLGKGRG